MQIVAPAGNFAGLRASVNAGADAVYLGMPLFGARAKAENFDDEALKEAVDFAHLYGVKVFVTLNTLIKDVEMNEAAQMAERAYKIGVDAAIVQDIRFIEVLKKRLPDFTLHASTQMGIHNAAGAEILKDLGIKRAVLSRETLPTDIKEIKKTGIEIEYFVQGALCVSFSGNCYFSSLASSYSGNRGRCMQLCRKPYVWHGNSGYYLSAKDLCMYDKLKMLEDLGVDAIKIEGRMRSEEYAHRSVSVYKSDMPTEKAVEALKSVFNRGDYCDGYLSENAQFRVIYPQSQSNIGRFVGKIVRVQGNKVFVNGFSPKTNDGFKILRNKNELCGASVLGGNITASGKCQVGDELRLTFDSAVTEQMKNAERPIAVDVAVKLQVGSEPNVSVSSGNTSVSINGEFIPQKAFSRAITTGDVKRAFEKSSDFPIKANISVDMEDEVFMPISALNELRRRAYSALKSQIFNDYKIKRSQDKFVGLDYNRFDGNGKILMVESGEQIDGNIISKIDYLVLNPIDYANFDIPNIDKPILLNMPVTMRGKDKDILMRTISREEIYGVISNNLYTLDITDKPILLGCGHNIIGDTYLPHIRSFEADTIGNGFAYVFGYAPLMTLCHCPYGKCVNCDGRDTLTDERGRKFALRRYRIDKCYWQLLNCVPHYLTAKDTAMTENLFYDCTAVDKNTILSVLSGKYSGEYTRGNMNKGLK
ncbi:MAG: U32 family peptidase [Clostridiales bacterium]|nr:U32 family peptidase [Clostridiales bacterium]